MGLASSGKFFDGRLRLSLGSGSGGNKDPLSMPLLALTKEAPGVLQLQVSDSPQERGKLRRGRRASEANTAVADTVTLAW